MSASEELREVNPALCDALWQEVCNWGRWGDADQAGALNLIDAQKRLAALATVSEGTCIGLGNPWPVTPSPHNPWPAEHRMLRAGDDCHYPGVPGLAVALDYIGVQHHGIACAHVDALCHVFVGDRMYNNFPATDVKSTGATKCDMSPMADGIVTRGVLLDITSIRGVPYLDGFDRISSTDLERAAEQQGVTVEPGDVLIVHKGRALREATEGVLDPVAAGMPGLHPECAAWLHAHGVAMLGSDYMNDPQPNWDCADWPIPIHYLGICGMGMTLLHNLETHQLAEKCRMLGRWSFLVTIAPLKVPGGTGSPVNPIAVL